MARRRLESGWRRGRVTRSTKAGGNEEKGPLENVWHRRDACATQNTLFRDSRRVKDRLDSPRTIDLKKDRGLSIEWSDGSVSYYSIAYLRRMSPSADMRQLRVEMDKNPLTVLPSGKSAPGPLVAVDAELVGNYAIKIRFSDGHDTGIYSWRYLRDIDPRGQRETPSPIKP